MTVETNRRVLVVDDDAETRGILRSALTHRSMEVDEASEGTQALDLIRERDYAVVVLDILMPGLDGYAVLDALQSTGREPVVLVVSGADRATLARLDSQRIHGVIRKPFQPLEVAALVEACTQLRAGSNYDTLAIAVLSSAPLLTLLS